ncbi:uncharacterized protein LOC122260910 [Penaeus japonicus]|uniref:uncharacterized protein LOC122260910 n=1 Tax=Penaeus japonicus TaxID=27405 RepID=UPI001C70EDBD|nr:uncharacterized protein LOC122260910 [Penaeus japonicus]
MSKITIGGPQMMMLTNQRNFGSSDVLFPNEDIFKGGIQMKGSESVGNGRRIRTVLLRCREKRKGVGIVVSPEVKEGILQVSYEEHEEDEFWELLGGVMVYIPDTEEVWLGGDLNGQVGEGNRETEVIGGHGAGRRNNPEENRIVDFAVENQLAALNNFRKRCSQLIAFSSGGRESQIDYIMSMRRGLKRVKDCKVLAMEARG